MKQEALDRSSLESEANVARNRLSRTLSSLKRRGEQFERSARRKAGMAAGFLSLGASAGLAFAGWKLHRRQSKAYAQRRMGALASIVGIGIGLPIAAGRRRRRASL
jgi:hypothetical protein